MKYQSVAVVDAKSGKVIVWHVDVSTNPSGLSRMSGAWVLLADDTGTLRTLTQGRSLTATKAGMEACERGQVDGYVGVVDLVHARTHIESEILRFQSLFEEAAAASKSKLIPPTWPRLPDLIDLASPPIDKNARAEVAVALGIARWLESLALVWESLEAQRLMRKYLRGDDDVERQFPVHAPELDVAKAEIG